MRGDLLTAGVEDDEAGAGGALVNGPDEGGRRHCALLFLGSDGEKLSEHADVRQLDLSEVAIAGEEGRGAWRGEKAEL